MQTIIYSLHPPLLVQHLSWTFLHSLWQILIFAGIFAAACRLFHNKPRLQYGIGLVTLAIIILSVVTTFFIVGRSFGGNLSSALPSAVIPTEAGSNIVELPPTQAPHSLLSQFKSIIAPYSRWLIAVWFIATIAIATFQLLRWLRFSLLLHRSSVFGIRHFLRLEQKGTPLPIARNVRVVECSMVDVPATVGWLKPILLVPISSMAKLDPSSLKAILVHEMAHVRRYDTIVNVCQTMIETLFFYHPAVWWISARIREVREICCDNVAMLEIGSTEKYLTALRMLEEVTSQRPGRIDPNPADRLVTRTGKMLGDPTLQLFGRGRAAGPTAILTLLIVLLCGTSLFAYSRSIAELRTLEHTTSIPSIVHDITGVHGRGELTEILASVVSELHQAPADEPPSLAEFANRVSSGVDPNELSHLIEARVDILVPFQFQHALSWRYGTFKDHSSIVSLLLQRADKLKTTEPIHASASARAALLFASECNYTFGAAAVEAVIRTSGWEDVAGISGSQMWRLKQLCSDEGEAFAQFSQYTKRFLSSGTIQAPGLTPNPADREQCLRRLAVLARYRPHLQWRLAALIHTSQTLINPSSIVQLEASIRNEPFFSRCLVQASVPARTPHRGPKVISADAFQRMNPSPTSRALPATHPSSAPGS